MTRWLRLAQEGSGNPGWGTVAMSELNAQSQKCTQEDREDPFTEEGGGDLSGHLKAQAPKNIKIFCLQRQKEVYVDSLSDDIGGPGSFSRIFLECGWGGVVVGDQAGEGSRSPLCSACVDSLQCSISLLKYLILR